jgi:hypothetical protein
MRYPDFAPKRVAMEETKERFFSHLMFLRIAMCGVYYDDKLLRVEGEKNFSNYHHHHDDGDDVHAGGRRLHNTGVHTLWQ